MLDLEYKKIQPGTLEVKQVREVPLLPGLGGQSTNAFLLDEPVEYVVSQGEGGDVFANHRLKCRLFASTRNLCLDSTNLKSISIYRQTSVELLQTTNTVRLTNGPAGWDETIHKNQGNACMADGSVQQLSSARLREQLRNTGLTNNHIKLSIP